MRWRKPALERGRKALAGGAFGRPIIRRPLPSPGLMENPCDPLSLSPLPSSRALLRSAPARAPRTFADRMTPASTSPPWARVSTSDDIQRTLQKLLNEMRDSAIMTEWRQRAGQNDRQTVSIAPFINGTSEHIDHAAPRRHAQRDRDLAISGGVVRVVSQERQADMIRQVEGAQHPRLRPSAHPAVR